MRALLVLAVLGTALPSFSGCPLFQQSTTIELVNGTDAELEVELLYDDDQDLPEDVLEETGRVVLFNIPRGEVREFSRNCGDIQAVRVRGDLQLIGDVGPSETSRVYRDGEDFNCGDTLTFTFSAPLIPTDLDISFSQRP